jgi:hypothetical protein
VNFCGAQGTVRIAREAKAIACDRPVELKGVQRLSNPVAIHATAASVGVQENNSLVHFS